MADQVLATLEAIRERDRIAECVASPCHQTAADRRFLLWLLEGEEEMRRSASRQARALMDFIRDDPAFPDPEDQMLFGDRAIRVITRMRAEIEQLRRREEHGDGRG